MRIKNRERLFAKLDALPYWFTRPVSDALNKSAQEIRATAIANIQRGGSSGRTYKRGSRVHVASVAGAFPNTDTGALVASMRAGMFNHLHAWAGTSLLYARYLEFGTSTMAARPFLKPTYKSLKAGIRKRVGDAVKGVLKGVRNG